MTPSTTPTPRRRWILPLAGLGFSFTLFITIDYQLAGTPNFELLRGDNPWIVYPGTLQGRSLGVTESGPKGAILVEVEDNFIAQNRWRQS